MRLSICLLLSIKYSCVQNRFYSSHFSLSLVQLSAAYFSSFVSFFDFSIYTPASEISIVIFFKQLKSSIYNEFDVLIICCDLMEVLPLNDFFHQQKYSTLILKVLQQNWMHQLLM